MAGFFPGRIKRKDFDEVNDEFSEFSLSAPARKTRRLDADLPPIMEVDEPVAALTYSQQQLPLEQMMWSTNGLADLGPIKSEAMLSCASNEDRALVLYKPVEKPLLLSPGQTLTMNPDLIHGLKNNLIKPGDERISRMDEKTAVSNSCLALVPWVPSLTTFIASGFDSSELSSELSQVPMEDEPENASMEVEEHVEQVVNGAGNEGFHQWQQHCMTSQLLANTPSPIMWSW